jgi:hypothetical protein
MPVEVGIGWPEWAGRCVESFYSRKPVFIRRLSYGRSLIFPLHLIAFMMQTTICAILAPIERIGCGAARAARTMVGSRTVWTRATRQVLGRLSSHGVDRIVQRSGKSPQCGCAGNRRRGTAPPTWPYRGQPSAASSDSCTQNSALREKFPRPEPSASQEVAEKYASVIRHQFRILVLGRLIFENTHSYNPLKRGTWNVASNYKRDRIVRLA